MSSDSSVPESEEDDAAPPISISTTAKESREKRQKVYLGLVLLACAAMLLFIGLPLILTGIFFDTDRGRFSPAAGDVFDSYVHDWLKLAKKINDRRMQIFDDRLRAAATENKQDLLDILARAGVNLMGNERQFDQEPLRRWTLAALDSEAAHLGQQEHHALLVKYRDWFGDIDHENHIDRSWAGRVFSVLGFLFVLILAGIFCLLAMRLLKRPVEPRIVFIHAAATDEAASIEETNDPGDVP